MSFSTPLNESATASDQSSSRWAEVLNSVDKTRPIALFAHHYADTGSNKEPSVLLGRSWDVQLKVPTAIWEKQYPKLAGPSDLSCFNQHEKNMLGHLIRVPHCAQFVDFRDVGNSSLFVAGKGLQASPSIPMLRTLDMGTSLKQWVKWGFTHHSKPYKHLFHLPAHYLRFARGALIALNEVHSTGMVQCDGNLGNWCIDTRYSPLSGTDEGVCIEPLWERVSIIDVGYAIHPSYPPPKMLPLGANGMAPLMVKATEKIEGLARSAFNRLSEQERQHGRWPNASTAMQDLGFWTRHAPDATAQYGLVDWRQDYWWLGQVLQELRKDGDNALWHANAAIRSLIGSEEYPATGLAHDLMFWGQTELPYDQEPEASNRRTLAKQTRKEIHQSLLQRLDAAIAQLTPQDGARTITLYRADFDAQYADQAAARRRAEEDAAAEARAAQLQKELNEKAKRAAAAEKAQRRAARLALYAHTANRAAAGLLGVLAVGGGIVMALEWGVPTWKHWQGERAMQQRQQEAEVQAARQRQEQQAKEAQQAEQKALGDYIAQSQVMGKSAWWQGKQAATPAQLQWVQDTLRYAQVKAWPGAQLNLGELHCSGIAPGLVAASPAACGRWLATALTNPAYGSLPEVQRVQMGDEVANWFDYMVYGPTRNNMPMGARPGYQEFALALLPGLQARGAQDPWLQARAAHTLACISKQPDAARAKLEAIVHTQAPDSPQAVYAQRRLKAWAAADYSSCNTERVASAQP